MFGLFKKKEKIPPLTDAMNATIAAVAGAIKLQVNAALGKGGPDFCPDLGAADNLRVALYAYGFLEGMAQYNGCVEAWSGGEESLAYLGYQTMLGVALLGVYGPGMAEICGSLAGLVFKIQPWKKPETLIPAGQEGMAFAKKGTTPTRLLETLTSRAQ